MGEGREIGADGHDSVQEMSCTTVIYGVLEHFIFWGEGSGSKGLITGKAYLSDMHKMRAVLVSSLL